MLCFGIDDLNFFVQTKSIHLNLIFIQLQKDGTYIANENNKVFYGSMMYVRAVIILDTYHKLASAVTIAIRYSAVRRQTVLYPK